MGKNSAISWCDHTFNPWWGCVEVSEACDECYARQWALRCGYDGEQKFDKENNPKPILPVLWGKDHQIRTFGDKHWNEPLKWNADAIEILGRPARVFCASMADVFEVHPECEKIRPRLLSLIKQTPNLEWLLLTKRAQEIKRHEEWCIQPNVRMGVTVESQDYTWRIVPNVQWLSVEPMIGPLDISKFPDLTWVVLGCESKTRSGKEPRPMEMQWALDLIQQCKFMGIRAHCKQTGDVLARELGLKDKSGKDPEEWPAQLQIQEFPAPLQLFSINKTINQILREVEQ